MMHVMHALAFACARPGKQQLIRILPEFEGLIGLLFPKHSPSMYLYVPAKLLSFVQEIKHDLPRICQSQVCDVIHECVCVCVRADVHERVRTGTDVEDTIAPLASALRYLAGCSQLRVVLALPSQHSFHTPKKLGPLSP